MIESGVIARYPILCAASMEEWLSHTVVHTKKLFSRFK